ncbi:GLPGLI family protein [Elizabethkingia ursingii]|uniref:GLPGLI family protein n=1 Tax=Elizabethkingia ursingii TaxID=1756150 RepID=UPI00099B14DA|nr:GLPGLI family protein [Elizabethkingia ursingii]OPC04685.1 GLPGLI family protein [Elizabethkingia ursingii]
MGLKKNMSGRIRVVINKGLIFYLLLPFFMFSQTNRFIYEYTFKMDSLNKSKIDKELMFLDVNKDKSEFYSYKKFARDSVWTASKSKLGSGKTIDFTNYNSKVDFSVAKDYKQNKTGLYYLIGSDAYTMNDFNSILWKIKPETTTILDFKVQLAETYLGGRKWKAWFCPDIPIQDGPYRFKGLPGLILKVEDINKDHTFMLVGTKSITEDKVYIPFTEKKIYAISHKLLKDVWKDYVKNPVKDMQLSQSNSSSNVNISVTLTDDNGRSYSGSEFIRLVQKKEQERLKRTNNFIELDLFK